jgi:serine/threonine protein kinase
LKKQLEKPRTLKPQLFGNYVLLDRLNVGGMAEVFRAKSVGLEGVERLVAIKRILPHLARDPDFTNMFIDEARIAFTLHHANIAQLYELSRVNDSLYIAMEYVRGRDLRALVNRMRYLKKRIPVPVVLTILAKLCEGLDYAHRKRDLASTQALGIVHRDISPQNVIVSYDGTIKIIDFGIAKAATKQSHTEAGILKGKFGYMAPEQVVGGDIDHRADLFCAGILLYELLTTERLFAGSTELSTLRKIRKVDIVPPRVHNPDIPEALEKIIMKALALKPGDRYPYASDLQEDIHAYLDESGERLLSTRKLSEMMKGWFAQDIEADRRKLERLLKLGEDVLAQAEAQSGDFQNAVPLPPAETAPSPDMYVPTIEREEKTDRLQKPSLDKPNHDTRETPYPKGADVVSSTLELLSPQVRKDLQTQPDEEVPPSMGAVLEEDADATVAMPSPKRRPTMAFAPPASLESPPLPLPPDPGFGLNPNKPILDTPTLKQMQAGDAPRRSWLWAGFWIVSTLMFIIMLVLLIWVPAPRYDLADEKVDLPPSHYSAKTPRLRLKPAPTRREKTVPDARPAPRSAIKKRKVTSRKKVRKPWPRFVIVDIRSTPRGASILMNGRRIGKTNKRLRFRPRSRTYVFKLRKKGHLSHTFRLRIRRGRTRYSVSHILPRGGR